MNEIRRATTSKTTFSKKCEILGSMYLFYKDDDSQSQEWKDFFVWADIALPISYAVWQGIATVKKGKESYVNDAWDIVCSMIDVDANDKYGSLQELFAASPNQPLDK